MSRNATTKGARRAIAGILNPAALVGVAVAAFLAGCGGSSSHSGGVTTGAAVTTSSATIPQVTLALNVKEPSLNVFGEPTVENLGLVSNVAEGLVTMDQNGLLHPGLASKWEEKSPTVYTYDLKAGQKFSNGTPVTMSDVLYSLRYAQNPKTGGVASALFADIKSIEASSATTVAITLKKPQSSFAVSMANSPGWIYEESALKAAGSNFGSAKGIPLGSGPYAITEFTSDHLTFVRNKYYSGPAPKAEKVVVRFITDDATRLAAMQSGDVQGALYVPPTDTPEWEAASTIHLQAVLSPNTPAWIFNLEKPPFNDVHVRRAMLYAYDRPAVISHVLHGNAYEAPASIAPQFFAGEISPSVASEQIQKDVPQYPFNLQKAKQELAQSASPHGFSTTVITTEQKELTLGLQVLAQNLKQIGINLKIHTTSGTALYEKAVHKEFTMISGLGALEGPAPVAFLYGTYCSCSIPPAGYNMSRVKNTEVDHLIEEATAQSEPKKRAQLNIETMAIIEHEMVQPTLWYPKNIVATSKSIVLTEFGPWSLLYTPWMANIRAAAG
jgi:peptide/nickel transport system substrate-binding protein